MAAGAGGPLPIFSTTNEGVLGLASSFLPSRPALVSPYVPLHSSAPLPVKHPLLEEHTLFTVPIAAIARLAIAPFFLPERHQ